MEDEESIHKMNALYSADEPDVQFRFTAMHSMNENDGWNTDIKEVDRAFFYENTDYPVRVLPNVPGIVLQRFIVGKEENTCFAADDSIIFGTLNFGNQVGKTDIKVVYCANGNEKTLAFSTEVLSYKMDCRTDMRQVIRDIEEEIFMLGFSFLKETYQTFRHTNNKSADLIWWQVFQDYYQRIVDAAEYIINHPRVRLRTHGRYERVEYLRNITPEQENEYAEFADVSSHLYFTEEHSLSKDTVENRFLKYVLQDVSNMFKRVRENMRCILTANNINIYKAIADMDNKLDLLCTHPFFRGIGRFKGFAQDSLVMKHARGYKDIYEYWIILQCGYEWQEGIMRLEVKDISELYEIWCFIKIKNIVWHILRDKADMNVCGCRTEGNFVKRLIQGKSSEVRFTDKQDTDLVLASVMYNATADDEAANGPDLSKRKTDIPDTISKTTEQRPDIVLRLSKSGDNISYTYLFDAKYRLGSSQISNLDVPPADTINQMHRYRDAIYSVSPNGNTLSREVIGGYVLYPGNLNADNVRDSYYFKSIKEVNIGAYPLKPGKYWHPFNSSLLLDPTAAESVLYQQIYDWLNEPSPRGRLLSGAIPQKGLRYVRE
ncbi:MAG: restriction endonuclease-like protein [Bacteroides sp.]|nr:restriction endonuclease-like protein [Roseburia sp.]MCM1346702.1 restriction endonuclease-like protein [Bacteroides sp.]